MFVSLKTRLTLPRLHYAQRETGRSLRMVPFGTVEEPIDKSKETASESTWTGWNALLPTRSASLAPS